MLPPTLISYLYRCLKAELPFDAIRPQLKQMGWTDQYVRESQDWYQQASQEQVDAPPLAPLENPNPSTTYNSIEQVIPKKHLAPDSFEAESETLEPAVSSDSGSFFYKTLAFGINFLTIIFFLAAILVIGVFLIISGTVSIVPTHQQEQLGNFVMEFVPGLE